MLGGKTNATAAAPRGSPAHVALLSSPGMGHVAPLAELTRRLHDAHGFTATVLTFASSDSAAQRAFLASLPPAVGSASLPAVPLGDDLPSGAAIETLLSVEAQRSVPALTEVLSGLKSTTNLVADLFGADTLRAARDAGVPGYLFFPSNLLMLSVMLHLPRLDADLAAGEFRDLPEPVRLPGCVPIPGADLLQPLQDRASDAYRWMVHHGERYCDAAGILVNTFDAAGILVNTFDAVEPGAAAALRQPEPWRPPVYPVGPVIRQHAADITGDATGCMDWLDAQPERSVLFVSFGSGGALSTAQMAELARGLELSGHRFLWVVRSPADGGEANPGENYYDGSRSKDDPLSFLPPGFVERTKSLGHVVPSWAPQTRVLGHRATAAMLTHCGWNSVLESIAAGVPMIAWPLYAEQRENAVMLCEETMVALRPNKVGDGGDGLILAEDVADVVKEMMGGGEKGDAARAKVTELKEASRSPPTPPAAMPTAADPAAALPLTLDLEDFKGDFSFDALFGGLVDELLPEYRGEDDAAPAPPPPPPVLGAAPPVFPAVDELLGLFKHSCKELVDLRKQIDKRLQNLKKEVAVQDSKHRKTLGELEKGVDGLFDSFARLDSRISSVGQTAAKIGDHLQSAESQRETASQTIDLIKYLMEFNSTPGDLMELSPLFSDDSRVAEAASIAQKLRSFAEEDVGRHGVTPAVGSANASRGLEVAVANLQEYCNELENRLLARFDSASQRRELSTMAECAKILSQFNRGTSAMQHYVATRPMFIDVDIMNTDIQVVLGDEGLQADSNYIADGLSTLYKEIADTVRREATTITAVFPSPNEVMAILVQRVLEQRVTTILDRILIKPSLASLPPLEGGLLQYLRILAVAYDKTKELAKDLQSIGCGDLDIEGLTESIYVAHKDEYTEFEQASLRQLYQSKMAELRAEAKQQSELSTGSIGRAKGASLTTSPQQLISVTVVTEFVRWNEEAIARCTLLFSQPTAVAANVRSIFACLLDQVSQYLTEGLDRARDSLNDAAAMRDRYVIGSSVSRRVAAAAASAAEAAASAGESSFRSFMIAVQRCASSVAILQQFFSNTISRLLLPVDGAHPSACEDMGSAVSVVEAAAHKGLLQCIDTVMSEVERLLSSEQKATDYRTPDDGAAPDHRPTNACIRIVAYLSRVLEVAFNALEGLNKQSFLTELGNRLHKGLLNHWQKFTFSPSGGLRLKRDITEYGDFVRSFNAPSIDEKFEQLGIVANVFIVAPESLASLFEGTPSIRKDALRFIQLRDDYKTAKIASMLNNITAE